MKISIRMIGLATTFFWIFLIAFFISAVYSTKDLRLNFGNPQLGITPNNELLFSLPITIVNNGYYNIGAFKMVTKISDEDSSLIAQGFTFIPVIKKNGEVIVAHNMTMDINDLLGKSQNYLFNDCELIIYGAVGMRIAEVIPVQASTNFSAHWGAPLYNFRLGEIEYTEYNHTHMRVIVPISFENHAFFNLVGDIQIRMYNSNNILVGEGQTNIEARSDCLYNGMVEFLISTMDITESGRFEVYFQTEFFNYGPLVIPYD